MFDLKNKVALVTGATGGIGEEIARSLARQGAKVVLSGTRKEKLEALAEELSENAAICPCALNDREAVARLVKDAQELAGPLDILVNNAGITRDGLAIRMKTSDWDSVIEINLTASFILMQQAVTGMMKRRHGRIINITSVSGVAGNPGQANYCASKAGLIGMSKSLAKEVATRGITVNCIAPGMIETHMTDVLNEKQREAILATIPMNRLGAPREIAAAVVYLASNEAAYTTGETIHVNGGMYMA